MPAAPEAEARPDVGAVETGSFFGVTTNDSESLATSRRRTSVFSSRQQHVQRPLQGRLPGRGSLRSEVSVFTSEQHGRLGRDDQTQSVTSKKFVPVH